MQVYGINMLETILPINWYNHVSLFIFVLLILKLFTYKDELFEEIEEIKGAHQKIMPKEELELLCFTELNTRINRDYLDSSSYYHQSGHLRIFGTDCKLGNKHYSPRPFRKNRRVTFPKEVIIAFD